MTSQEVRSDLGRPPHFDGTNYPLLACSHVMLFGSKSLGVWRVKPQARPNNPTKADEKEIHFNPIPHNSLLESLSINVFNRVYNLKSAHEISYTLKELRNGTSDVREQKYLLVKVAFNSFKILPNELTNDMYS
jgi:hypothetical protein